MEPGVRRSIIALAAARATMNVPGGVHVEHAAPLRHVHAHYVVYRKHSGGVDGEVDAASGVAKRIERLLHRALIGDVDRMTRGLAAASDDRSCGVLRSRFVAVAHPDRGTPLGEGLGNPLSHPAGAAGQENPGPAKVVAEVCCHLSHPWKRANCKCRSPRMKSGCRRACARGRRKSASLGPKRPSSRIRVECHASTIARGRNHPVTESPVCRPGGLVARSRRCRWRPGPTGSPGRRSSAGRRWSARRCRVFFVPGRRTGAGLPVCLRTKRAKSTTAGRMAQCGLTAGRSARVARHGGTP